ncbi:uncharacterized protein HMPREF1541_10304 [Cyphellophora europaea CBS 101466]|uniref:DUF7703 domain-containing protein n=1 Tax=Cyphellophora europaea (strain CBS 101466) TaxID=1220924 RepID=W2S9N4_CYPE1|nr:uncharacterized protein HMPREF1541_10304 [Cyphellophora europaea CBS 101466]ETN44634.1 hypothetical protein HMPREF1541_10304 [Cyphellophora europaea CBS 101466]
MESDSSPTASSSSPSSAGAGITGGYEGNSLALKVCIAFFLSLAIYNVLELLVLIFGTFQKFRGLYFWSLVVSGVGIIPYALGFLFKYFNILTGSARWASVFLLSIGWYPMVTGQAIVLWSRLHLVVHGGRGDKILLWTKWMIIVNAICLHIPTTVLTFGSNANIQTFIDGYNVMEKLQMCGFFVQEVVLSSIYIIETVKILRSSVQRNTRRLMYQLIAINVLIIIMDLGLLGLEAASLYILETIFKGFLYSLKLKLEFAILSKLVQFVGRGDAGTRQRSETINYFREDEFGPPDAEKSSGSSTARQNNLDVPDFVDLSRVKTDMTHASPAAGRTSSVARHGVTEFDLDLARLEHVETVSSMHSRKPNGDIEQNT